MIYLDYNATSPYSKSVVQFIQNELASAWANPSSEHAEGAQLGDEIKLIRAEIAESLGCSSKQIIFTSGATESINTVLSVDNLESLGIRRIITSPMEHHATLDRVKYLDKKGFKIEMLRNNENGILDLGHLEELLKDKSATLVSLLFANNETGVINPVKEISTLVRKFDQKIHIDGVQALGKIRFNLEELDVDFMSFSGHKIGSLKGIGLLFAKDIKKLSPLLHGGGQERGFRPGTLNFSAIKSLKLAICDSQKWDLERMLEIRHLLEKQFKDKYKVHVNCERSTRLCNTISIFVEGKNSREILNELSRQKVYVSTGSACSSGTFSPSHVLTSLGYDKHMANSSLRISFGPEINIETISNLLNIFNQVLT